jgi:pilus assembly protein CpaF
MNNEAAGTDNAADASNGGFDAWQLANHYLAPIISLLKEQGVSEISANRFDEIYVTNRGVKTKRDVRFANEEHITLAIKQTAQALGQSADEHSCPILDARLSDGSRFAAALYPVSTRGSSFSIRVFPAKAITTTDLLGYGSMNADMLEFLRISTLLRSNTLVSGGTGSGKTTLLNALSSLVPKTDRVLTCEDTHELRVDTDDYVTMEAPERRRQDEQAQVVTLTELIKHTLRRTPDRIFVGEIRDAKAAQAFLYAINTGHSGSCSTIHANNTTSALVRLQTLVAGGDAGLPYEIVRDMVRSDIHILIHTEHTPKHGKRVVELAEVRNNEVKLLWQWHYGEGRHVCNEASLAESVILERALLYSIDSPLSKKRKS